MMRSHDVRYLVREGFRNTWQNRFMALASVGVLICCLLLTGFSYLVFVNIDHLFQTAYEQNVVAVYLDESLRKFDTVYPAAGNGHTAVKLTLQELEAAAGAEGWVDVCKEPEGE